MGIFNRSGNKAGPRELGEDELPSAMDDQPTTPKQRRLWRGKSQQKVSEDASGSDPTAETDLSAQPAQKKRGLFSRKKVHTKLCSLHFRTSPGLLSQPCVTGQAGDAYAG